MYRVWNFITSYSLFLIGGALLALIWANTHPEAYHSFTETVLKTQQRGEITRWSPKMGVNRVI